jgi:hypothetical protein
VGKRTTTTDLIIGVLKDKPGGLTVPELSAAVVARSEELNGAPLVGYKVAQMIYTLSHQRRVVIASRVCTLKT